jgi:GMP synthase (glutamine-hydrolysing)
MLYDFVVGLGSVTCDCQHDGGLLSFEMEFIGHVATRIINEVRGVNR